MKKQKMITVSFEIPVDDYQKFDLLETIALSKDQSYLKLLSAMTRHFQGRRKRTASEIHQRAVWMRLDDSDIAK